MRTLSIVVGVVVLLVGASLAAPAPAAAGCSCGCSGCVYSGLNTIQCRHEGGCLCTMGPSGAECLKPVAFDGTVSESRLAGGEAPRSVLTRRPCDGAVVTREYSVAAAEALRRATRTIHL